MSPTELLYKIAMWKGRNPCGVSENRLDYEARLVEAFAIEESESQELEPYRRGYSDGQMAGAEEAAADVAHWRQRAERAEADLARFIAK